MEADRRSYSQNDEDKFLIKHILDLSRQRDISSLPRFSSFLDERQLVLCTNALISAGCEFTTDGGYEQADRRIIAFYPYDYCSTALTYTPVVFNYREQDKPSHRDILGTLMALEIKRETVGDIIIGNTRAVTFVLNSVLPLVSRVTKVGKCGVKITYDFYCDDIPQRQYDEITSTVATVRLDSVLALTFGFSREKAQTVIKSKGIILNGIEVFDTSVRMNEGDVFSLRGFGKAMLYSIGGQSKKGRNFITVKKYK